MPVNARTAKDAEGFIYLVHFDPCYKHAGHYLGWTSRDDVKVRFQEHRMGQGARLIEVAVAAGCGFRLFILKRGTRTEERRLKGFGGRGRLCPYCRGLKTRPVLHVPPGPRPAGAFPATLTQVEHQDCA